MNRHRIRYAALLFIAALAPASASADLIDVSDILLGAFASFQTQLAPRKVADVSKMVPPNSATQAEALVRADGIAFPNLPNDPGQAFASAAIDGRGNFGVGVNGFFFTNSLPPNALASSAVRSQFITNNSAVAVGVSADFFIPPPTFQFFGIGNAFPGGVDPRRDATASVNAKLVTTLTRADGTTVQDIPFDYGMELFREPVRGELFAIPTSDAEGGIARFEEPDGSFGFELAFRLEEDFSLGEIGPGERLEIVYAFSAAASTGFGETGVFAAIGDPFDLSAGGGRFEVQIGAAVPEPATWVSLATGLLALGWAGRAGTRRRRWLRIGARREWWRPMRKRGFATLLIPLGGRTTYVVGLGALSRTGKS